MSGVNRQILFNTVVTTSTHAYHSIRRFSFETERLVSPSSSFSLNHLRNHSFPQFLLNDPFILPSLLHSPFSSFLSPSHSPSSTHSIPILPFKFHPHRIASLSHPLPIHSPSSTHSIPILPFKIHPHYIASLSSSSNLFSIIHTFHSHSSFQIPSSSHCISLSSSSNPFSIIHVFYSHSSFQIPSSLHCISLPSFPSLFHHSHIHFLTSFHLPLVIATLSRR